MGVRFLVTSYMVCVGLLGCDVLAVPKKDSGVGLVLYKLGAMERVGVVGPQSSGCDGVLVFLFR